MENLSFPEERTSLEEKIILTLFLGAEKKKYIHKHPEEINKPWLTFKSYIKKNQELPVLGEVIRFSFTEVLQILYVP